MDKSATESLIDQATALLSVTRQLDYVKILQHDRTEVEKLRGFVSDSMSSISIDTDLGPDAFVGSAQANTSVGVEASATSAPADTSIEADGLQKQSQQEELKANRQMAILEQLSIEGFSDRLGKVYNSRSEERSMEFRKVPHHKNLPEFDMIVSADYSPGAGVHGIAISEHHVMAVFLASPEEQNEWEMLKRRAYDNMEEMGEYVTLMSAGFDLP
ncbi:MAG: hypothetical protein ACJA0N_002513 [Pseudohongiellaceae bacterium]|jgi:hypothetical protein